MFGVEDDLSSTAEPRIKAEEDADLIHTLVAEDMIRRAVDALR